MLGKITEYSISLGISFYPRVTYNSKNKIKSIFVVPAYWDQQYVMLLSGNWSILGCFVWGVIVNYYPTYFTAFKLLHNAEPKQSKMGVAAFVL